MSLRSSDILIENMGWGVYLLKCADNTLYCGVTNNIRKRLRQHNGEIKGGAKYTSVRRPCQLVFFEQATDRSEASRREAQLKKLPRSQKLLLCRQ